jgi:DNA-binding transcriptional LysR family regulator
MSNHLQAALPQLSMFLAVARHRSFSGAARELGVSTSAVSQSVRQLEAQLRVVLLRRTTRAVTPTEAGTRLLETAGEPVKLALAALESAHAKPGEVVGRVKVGISETALPLVLEKVVPVLRARHPGITLEVVVDEHVVDAVAGGFDAVFEITEVTARDMVRIRVTEPFQFRVVGSPKYFAKHGTPKKPEDLLRHDCINFRWPAGDAFYAWEFQRGRRKWRVPVRGSIVTNHAGYCVTLAEQGLGLAYIADLNLKDQLRDGRLVSVLDVYSATEPGIFLCYPSRAQRSPALALFVEVTRELLRR